jgi:hypothetical protein
MKETSEQLTIRLAKYKPLPPVRLCAWCNSPLPPNSPSAMKYHSGECRESAYADKNAEHSRAFRFRKEMGIVRSKTIKRTINKHNIPLSSLMQVDTEFEGGF